MSWRIKEEPKSHVSSPQGPDRQQLPYRAFVAWQDRWSIVEENGKEAPFRIIDPLDGREYDVVDVE